MKTVNVRELHDKTGAIVDLAAAGQPIRILRRGTPVAELRPLGPPDRGRTLPDREALLRRFPAVRGDSGAFLEEDRR